MKNHTKYSALITSSLLIVALAGPANATEPVRDTSTIDVQSMISFSADPTAKVTYPKTTVKTTPAPAPEPAPKAQVAAAVYTPAETKTPQPVASKPQQTATQSAKSVAPVSQVSASGKGASIAAAAYAQLGVSQDCTALATNSLAAVGINFHGWPAGYLSLGRTVSAAEAQPGDLAYYQNGGSGMAHIAVYVGGGKAVHGGWNGGTTSLQSVNVGSGPVFIRV